MRFAILGPRGIPARYGGFETFAEELSSRLAARGHQVTVYCRARHPEPSYLGVRLVTLPTIRHKYFDTVVHTALSTAHALGCGFDVLLVCNAANAAFVGAPPRGEAFQLRIALVRGGAPLLGIRSVDAQLTGIRVRGGF